MRHFFAIVGATFASLIPSVVAQDIDPVREKILLYRDQFISAVKPLTGADALAKLKTVYQDAEQAEDDKLESLKDHKANDEIIDSAYDAAQKVLSAKLNVGIGMSPANFNIVPNVAHAISVGKTSAPDDLKKSASLAYDQTPSKEVYTFQGAVVVDFPESKAGTNFIDPQLGLDFDLSSDKAKNPGKITARLDATIFSALDDATAKVAKTDESAYYNTLFIPELIYITNRNLKPQSLLGELLVLPAFSIGSMKFNWNDKLGHIGTYQLNPVFGFDFGSVLGSPSKPQPEHGSFARGVAKVHFQFVPNKIKKLSFYVDDTVRFLGDDHYHSYNLLAVSGEYDIDKNWTFTVSYTIGRDEPTFDMNEEFKAGVGFKY